MNNAVLVVDDSRITGFSGKAFACLSAGRDAAAELPNVVLGCAASDLDESIGRAIRLIPSDVEFLSCAEAGSLRLVRAILDGLADALDVRLTSSLPVSIGGSGDKILGNETGHGGEEDVVLFIKVDFELRPCGVNGNVALVLHAVAAAAFAGLIEGCAAKRVA